MIAWSAVLFAVPITAFPLVIGYAFATGEIDLSRLLVDKQLAGLSQVRVQLLLVTISGAAFYITQAAMAFHAGTTKLPDIPQPWLVMLGLSNGLYIGGKSASATRRVFNALKGGSK